MINDQLTRAERIRLEALAQAIAHVRAPVAPKDLFEFAIAIERFLLEANKASH